MLRFLNKFFSNPTSRLRSRRGQVAIVLILITAISLILYAAVLNLSKVSQTKTATTIAANTTASMLASMLASYGEAQFQTTLGGRTEVCGWTSGWIVPLTVLLVVAIIVLAVVGLFCGGCTWGAIPYLVGLLLVLGVPAVIQGTYVQPGLTRMWNRMMEKQLTPLDTFVERGVQSALQQAVSDQGSIPDMHDIDTDGVYGDIGNPKDWIGRFGYYYYEGRTKKIRERSVEAITNFLTALDEFLYKGADDWGLYDPIECPSSGNPCCGNSMASPYIPSVCDQCCLPIDFEGEDVRPPCCFGPTPTAPQCGSPAASTTCGTRSGADWSDPYPGTFNDIFEGYLDNDRNSFLSFREKLGRDDESILYTKNNQSAQLNPNGQQTILVPNPTSFSMQDTTGYYTPPAFGPPSETIYERRFGFFSWLYRLRDWGIDLPKARLNNYPQQECHWCDPTYPGGAGLTCTVPLPRGLSQGNFLPRDPATVPYSGGACVDGASLFNGHQPLLADKVGQGERILAPQNQCADQDVSDANVLNLWKGGGDRFCSGFWPYSARCSKHNTCGGNPDDCTCAQSSAQNPANARLWFDDTLDDITYGLPEFIQWASQLLKGDRGAMALDPMTWYSEAAQWIERRGDFSNLPKDGGLWIWLEELATWRNEIEINWMNNPNYEGVNWEDTWCYPPETGQGAPLYMPAAERAAIYLPNTKRSIDKVQDCLDWNVNDPSIEIGASGPIAVGNAEKFYACAEPIRCGQHYKTCQELPRSLLPPSVYNQAALPNIPDRAGQIMQCLMGLDDTNFGACTAATCGWVDSEPSTSSYFLMAPFNPVTWNCASWGVGSGNPIFDYLAAREFIECPVGSCACRDGNWLNNNLLSSQAAENQVAKFDKRLKFLAGDGARLQGLIPQGEEFLRLLNTAVDAFSDFLGNEAHELIEALKTAGNTPGLPSQGIYAWQGEPSAGRLRDGIPEGYWHITRADVRIPGRCNEACGVNGLGPDPRWPWVKSRKVSWGAKRCYDMESTRGMVKVRVTRYDEDRDPNTIRFPFGEKIWSFNLFHPGSALISNPRPVRDQIQDDCGGLVDPLDLQWDQSSDAFIINEATENMTCWETLNKLLLGGVATETCAEYYMNYNTPQGFYIKFVPCANFE